MLSQMIERLKNIGATEFPLSMVLAGSALLSGCAALGVDQSEQPVMVSEVIRMSKENVPAETIVNKMRDSRAVYRLNAAQLAQLHDQGVARSASSTTCKRLTSTPSAVNKTWPIGALGKCGAIIFGKRQG